MLFRRSTIYAVIETGGKQYTVTPGKTVDVDYMGVAEGSPVELDKVLLIADGDKVKVGAPTVEGAKVMATSKGDIRGKKIIVFHYKHKIRYQKKQGHRQLYTRLLIDQIQGSDEEAAAPVQKPKARRAKKEVKPDGA